MDFSDKIKEIAANVFNVELAVITDDLSTGDIEGWDSVGNLAFITSLEEELDVDIPIEDLFELTDIKSIVEEINRLKSE